MPSLCRSALAAPRRWHRRNVPATAHKGKGTVVFGSRVKLNFVATFKLNLRAEVSSAVAPHARSTFLRSVYLNSGQFRPKSNAPTRPCRLLKSAWNDVSLSGEKQIPRFARNDSNGLSMTGTFFQQAASISKQFARLRMFLAIGLITLACAGCRKQAPLPAPYVAFVVNRQSNSVTVLNLASAQILASIPVAPLPQEAVQRPKSQEIYVVSESGEVSVIAFPSLAVVHQFEIGQAAHDLAFAPDGSRAYTLEPDKGQIVFLNCATMQETARVEVAPGLGRLALTPDGKTLVASDPAGNRLFFVSTQAQKLLGSVKVGKAPGPLVISLDSTEVFVADTGEDKVSVAEINSRAILSNIEIGAKPSGLALKPDGGELFVLSKEGSDMTILDASHANVEQVLPTGLDPVAAAFTRDSSVMFLASAGDGFVTAFDLANRNVLSTVHIGVAPGALALTPDERFLAVADSTSGNLAIVRTSPLALVTTVPVGADPANVIVPGWKWMQ